MALLWQAAIILQCILFINCAPSEPISSDFNEYYSPQIRSILDYLNADAYRQYNYNFGYLLNAQQKTDDVIQLEIEVDADCIDQNACNAILLICNSYVQYFSYYNQYRALPGVNCYNKYEIATRSGDEPQEVTEEIIEKQMTQQKHCVGCAIEVNKNAEGVDALVTTALQHIESERGNKHVALQIIKVEKQIVSGIKLTVILEVAPTLCDKNSYVVNVNECPIDKEAAPQYCMIRFIQKPWLSEDRHIISNNCTVSQEFVQRKSRIDIDNEIDVNADYLGRKDSADMNDNSPNFDKMAEDGNLDVVPIDPLRLLDLESQIIPSDKNKVESTKSALDMAQLGVEDIPSVQTSTDSVFEGNDHFTEQQKMMQDEQQDSAENKSGMNDIKKGQSVDSDEFRYKRQTAPDSSEESKESDEVKSKDYTGDGILARKRRSAEANERASSEEEKKTPTVNEQTNPAGRKRDVHSDESKSSEEETKVQTETEGNEGEGNNAARKKREIVSSEESRESEEVPPNSLPNTATRRRRRDLDSTSEESDEREIEDAVEHADVIDYDDLERKKRDTKDDSSSSSSSEEDDKKNGNDADKDKKDDDDKDEADKKEIIKKHKKYHKKEDLKDDDDDKEKINKKDDKDDSSSSSSEDDDNKRNKRSASSSSSSSSSSDDDDDDNNNDNNNHDEKPRKNKKYQSKNVKKHMKDDKDDNGNDKDDSSSSSSRSSDDDDNNNGNEQKKRHKRNILNSNKNIANELADYVAKSYNTQDVQNRVKDVLKVKKTELEGSVYHLTLRIEELQCDEQGNCGVVGEKLCKAQVHLSQTENVRILKSFCNKDEKNRLKRQIPGAPFPADQNSDEIKQLAKSALLQLDSESKHDNKYKIVEILDVHKQVVSGLLFKINAKIILSDCPKTSDKESELCGEHPSAKSKLCLLKIWDQPWLSKRETNVTCDNDEHYSFRSTRSLVNQHLLGQDDHDIHLGLFKSFMTTYNKRYQNKEEMMHRFRVYRENMKMAKILNEKEQGTARYGDTQFADLTKEEFKHYLGYRPELAEPNNIPFAQAETPDIELPPAFDWRDKGAVTAVKDQGQCGSCWAFSVTGNVEGQYAIQHGKLLEFSEQELVDCDKVDEGCNGGLMDNAYRVIEQMGGLETEKDYPYDAEDEKCTFNKSMTKVQLSGALNISQDETEMAKWLTKNGPISIAINANAMQLYMGGVSHPWKTLCSPDNLDHGVLIVGYGVHKYPLFKKSLPYWIVKNSWGKSWGEQGYYRVYRGDGTCGVNKTPSSAIVA